MKQIYAKFCKNAKFGVDFMFGKEVRNKLWVVFYFAQYFAALLYKYPNSRTYAHLNT